MLQVEGENRKSKKNTLHCGYISCSLITTTSVQTQSFPAGCLSCHSTNWTNIVHALNDGHYAQHCVQKLCWEKKFSICVDVLEVTIASVVVKNFLGLETEAETWTKWTRVHSSLESMVSRSQHCMLLINNKLCYRDVIYLSCFRTHSTTNS